MPRVSGSLQLMIMALRQPGGGVGAGGSGQGT